MAIGAFHLACSQLTLNWVARCITLYINEKGGLMKILKVYQSLKSLSSEEADGAEFHLEGTEIADK